MFEIWQLVADDQHCQQFWRYNADLMASQPPLVTSQSVYTRLKSLNLSRPGLIIASASEHLVNKAHYKLTIIITS